METVPKSKFVEQNVDPNQQLSRSGPTPRELIAMKKESKKAEEEGQLTFHPKFSAKSKDDNKSSSSSGSRFDKLYSEAMKRQQDNVEHPKPLPNASDYTFKPKISARAISRSKRAPSPLNVTNRLYTQSGAGRTSIDQLEIPPPTFQPQISKRAISVERNQSRDISDRLYQLGKEHQDKLDKLKQEYTNNKLHQECTFAPKINLNGTGSRSRSSSTSRSVATASDRGNIPNNTNMTSTSTSTTNHNDVTNRLLNYEERRLIKLEEAKKQQLEFESQNATFKPTVILTKRASTPNRQPGETVFDKLSKQMLQKDMLLSPPIAADANQLINKTAVGSDMKLSDGKVFERLTAVNTDRQHMQAVLDKVKQDLELSGCTFQPQVYTTNSIHNTAGNGNHTKPIHQRLEEETEKWKEDIKKREDLKIQEELKGATFTPVIPARSTAIGHSTNGPNGSTIFDRLTSEAEKNKMNHEYRVEQRRLEEMREATFAPTLPQKSLDITSNRSPSRRASTPTSSAPNSPTHRTAAATAAGSFVSPASYTAETPQHHQSDCHTAVTTATHITPKSVMSIPNTIKRSAGSSTSTSSAFKESSGFTPLTNSARGGFKGSLRNNSNSSTPVTTTTSSSTSMNNRQSPYHTSSSVTKRPAVTTTTAATTPTSVKTTTITAPLNTITTTTNNTNSNNNITNNNSTNTNTNNNTFNTTNSPTRSLKTIASATVDDQPPVGVPTLRGQRKPIVDMHTDAVVTAAEEVEVVVEAGEEGVVTLIEPIVIISESLNNNNDNIESNDDDDDDRICNSHSTSSSSDGAHSMPVIELSAMNEGQINEAVSTSNYNNNSSNNNSSNNNSSDSNNDNYSRSSSSSSSSSSSNNNDNYSSSSSSSSSSS